MKLLCRSFTVLALLVIFSIVLIPAFAQGGEGGTVIESNIGDDPSTFNPIISNDTTSSDVHDWMYPDIIALDDALLIETPGAPDGLAESWEYDETGTVLTVHLRQDLTWSDGTSVTVDDYIYSLEAVRSGQTSSPRTYVFWELDDGSQTEGVLFDYEKIDDYTIQFTLGNPERDEDGEWTGGVIPNCVAIGELNDIPPVPAHIYEAAFGDNFDQFDSDPYFVPTAEDGTIVTFGEFTDPYMEFGVQVSLVADQNYPDTVDGFVSPGEWILQQVEDSTVEYERFLAGDFSVITVTSSRQNEMRDRAETDGYQILEYPSNGYTFINWNLADPNNPMDARDADGNLNDQGYHPVLGDKLVRQALAHATDVESIIGTRPDAEGNSATGILEGNGYPIATHNHPGLSWVDPELDPYVYDPILSLELLEEAGWVDNDGDGQLECNDCLYAREVDAAYNGTPMEFEMLSPAGSTNGTAIGESLVTAYGDLGITVNFQAVEFGTLLDLLNSQTFDSIIIAWNLGLPFDPDGRWALGIASDRINGFNAGSYVNEDVDALWERAVSLPGCAQEERAELYREAMQLLYEDQPYLWLYAGNTMVAAQPGIANFDPLPYNADWNIDAWTIGE